MTSTHRPLSLAIGGLVALAVAMGIGRFVYTPILPFMVESIPLTAAQAGLIASANFVGYLAGALLAATPWIAGSRRTGCSEGSPGAPSRRSLTAARPRCRFSPPFVSSAEPRAPSSWSSRRRRHPGAAGGGRRGAALLGAFRRSRRRHRILGSRRRPVAALRLRVADAMGDDRPRLAPLRSRWSRGWCRRTRSPAQRRAPAPMSPTGRSPRSSSPTVFSGSAM